MKGQRGKQIAITRKQQRALKYREPKKFSFIVFCMNDGHYLASRIFEIKAIDSEEAFVNASAWAAREYKVEVLVEEYWEM